MALTAVDFIVFQKLKQAGLLPVRPKLLELGESEWYGDVSMQTLSDSIETLVADDSRREELHRHMAEVLAGDSPYKSWQLGKLFYRIFLDYQRLVSIDLHGTPSAKAIDLNYPVDLDERFGVVVNGGTGEHVFNVCQFFKTVHDLTEPNGLMIHVMPFRGWVEHGFYSFNATFYWDLAAANDYAVHLLAYTEVAPSKLVALPNRERIVELARGGGLGDNANLYAVMRKQAQASEFRIPRQGVYAGTIGQRMVDAWRDTR
jgi:hypothetical protein